MLYKKEQKKNTINFRFMLRGPQVVLPPGRGSYYDDERYFFVDWVIVEDEAFVNTFRLNASNSSILRKDSAVLAQIADCMDNSRNIFEFEAAIRTIGFVEEK